MKCLLSIFCLIASLVQSPLICGTEIFDSQLEAIALQHIEQLTFPSMGFEKAGEAYFSSDSRQIIFQAVPAGQENYQIFVMDLDERIPRLVSTGQGACTCAYFHPNGEKIIFASSHEDPHLQQEEFQPSVPGYQRSSRQYAWDFTPYMNVYEANPDGTSLIGLTQGPAYSAECAYSADGTRIVFASNRDGSMNIYTMKADGSDVQPVTQTKDCYNGGPFYSPDGNWIIFRADREEKHYLQIYRIRSDGTQEEQLTNNGAVNWAPYWHPNGEVIAFTTSLHGHRNYEIYIMNIRTGKQARLTHHASFDGLPVFNRDGTKLMWTSKRGPDQTCQIFLADFNMPAELE